MSDARKSGKGAVIKASLSYSQWKFGIAPGTNFPAYNFSTRSRACPYFFPPKLYAGMGQMISKRIILSYVFRLWFL